MAKERTQLETERTTTALALRLKEVRTDRYGEKGVAERSGVSPARLASLHHVLDRQLDQLGMDTRAEAPQDVLLDCVGLTADARREVAAPAMVARRHLRQARSLAVGDPGADPGFQILAESFEHPPHHDAGHGLGSSVH
jgi:hypothetical protein